MNWNLLSSTVEISGSVALGKHTSNQIKAVSLLIFWRITLFCVYDTNAIFRHNIARIFCLQTFTVILSVCMCVMKHNNKNISD